MKFLFSLLILSCSNYVIFAQPTNDLLKTNIGRTLALQKIDSAIYWGIELTNIYPSTESYLLLGSLYEIKNNTGAANLQYEKALDISDTNKYHVYSTLAHVWLNRNNNNRAIEYARQSIELNPNQPKLYYLIASIYQSENQSENANRYFDLAYRYDSTNINYIERKYVQTLSEGNIIEAIHLLEKTLPQTTELRSRNLEYVIDSAQLIRLMALADGYLQTDQFQKANALLLAVQSNKLLPDSGYYLLAESYRGMGDKMQAASTYKTAIQLSPSRNQLYYNTLVGLYEQLGEPQMAIDLIIEGSESIEEYRNWRTEYNEALKIITDINDSLATATEEDKKQMLFRLAQLYTFTKHHDYALQVLKDPSLKSSQSDSVNYLKSTVHFSRGKYAEAESLVRTILETNSNDAETHYLLFIILFQQRKYEVFLTAVKTAEQSGVNTNTPQIQMMITKSKLMLGQAVDSKILQTDFR